MPTPPQQYIAEFKREAVQLVLSTGKRGAQIARDLVVHATVTARMSNRSSFSRQGTFLV